jgi:hypothetical protein
VPHHDPHYAELFCGIWHHKGYTNDSTALNSGTTETTAAKQTSVEWPNFELPKLAAYDPYHDLFEQTCITLARGASEFSAKVVDTMIANAHNILEFTGELASARSWPEVVATYTSQGRKQFDAFSAQTQELSKLAQKVTTDALAPITSALPEMLETAAASI